MLIGDVLYSLVGACVLCTQDPDQICWDVSVVLERAKGIEEEKRISLICLFIDILKFELIQNFVATDDYVGFKYRVKNSLPLKNA